MSWTQRLVYAWAIFSGCLGVTGLGVFVYELGRERAKTELKAEIEAFDVARALELKRCVAAFRRGEGGAEGLAGCINNIGGGQ